jgi:hypothetical protein
VRTSSRLRKSFIINQPSLEVNNVQKTFCNKSVLGAIDHFTILRGRQTLLAVCLSDFNLIFQLEVAETNVGNARKHDVNVW